MRQGEGLDRILECDSIWKPGRLEEPEKKPGQVWPGTGEKEIGDHDKELCLGLLVPGEPKVFNTPPVRAHIPEVTY